MQNVNLHMETILPSVQVAIVLTDASRQILWVNDHFTTMTGYSLAEVRGKRPSLLQGPRTEHAIIEEMRHCLERGKSFKNEVLNYRKNGETYHCRLVVHAIRDEAGEITNFIAFEIEAGKGVDDRDIDLMHFSSKYQTSSLKGEKSKDLYERLKQLMSTEQIYRDPCLSLPQLADLLDSNTKYLSQVVNHHFGSNLQHFINVYRVDESKRRLLDEDNDNLTYYGIGQLCGFKNKSTFYKVFRRFTQLTPHEYVQLAGRQVSQN